MQGTKKRAVDMVSEHVQGKCWAAGGRGMNCMKLCGRAKHEEAGFDMLQMCGKSGAGRDFSALCRLLPCGFMRRALRLLLPLLLQLAN